MCALDGVLLYLQAYSSLRNAVASMILNLKTRLCLNLPGIKAQSLENDIVLEISDCLIHAFQFVLSVG